MRIITPNIIKTTTSKFARRMLQKIKMATGKVIKILAVHKTIKMATPLLIKTTPEKVKIMSKLKVVRTRPEKRDFHMKSNWKTLKMVPISTTTFP